MRLSQSSYDFSLEELMKIEVSTGTLTNTTKRDTPNATTVINRKMINSAKARSLQELLDIYVPNIQVIRHHWEMNHIGARGIINDLENKYLLLVNGRNMNHKTHAGAFSEIDLPLMGDIHRIEIIRGPASAIYGPGAISMVINIITENAKTFEGTEVSTTMGAVDEYGTVEFKHGLKIDHESGLYFYLGLAKANGSKSSNSPEKITTTDTTIFGDHVQSGKPVTYDVSRDNQSHHDRPDIKMHLNFTKGNWDNWIRLTRGGRKTANAYQVYFTSPTGWANPNNVHYQNASNGYQHLTLLSSYLQEVSDKLEVKYTLSYDTIDYNRDHTSAEQSYREDELYGQIMSTYDFNSFHKLALGIEGSYEEFGRDAYTFNDDTSLPSPWSTNTYSLVSEYQWILNDKWTMFLGGRVDEHSYTDTMYSPRTSFIYKATDQDTFKLLVSQSAKTNNAEEMRKAYVDSGSTSDSEKITSYELRWERQQTAQLSWGLSAYYHDMELIAYDTLIQTSIPMGDLSIWGAELEINYETENTFFWFSHGYSKLDQFNLDDGVTKSLISVAPNGYGDDLANWSNHITKFGIIHKINSKFEVNSSMRIYWGFPGDKDAAEYNKDTPYRPAYDGSSNRSFEENLFFNLGFKYFHDDKTTLSVNGYNILGVFDEDLNKRNYYGDAGNYRSEAPSISFSVNYKF